MEGEPVADTGLPTNAEMAKLYPYTDIKDSNVTYNQIATFNRDQPLGGNDGGICHIATARFNENKSTKRVGEITESEGCVRKGDQPAAFTMAYRIVSLKD